MKSKRESKQPLRRRDGTGHINQAYASELLALSGHSDGDAKGGAFVDRPYSNDELSEELGEAFVEGATSGEGAESERRDEVEVFEEGGPFVVTDARREFAEGTDDSNPAGATQEPFPRAMGGGEGS
jgi:hypothetical protein